MPEERSKFTPRPTVYNGVKMRSRLEAGFAMWLDEMGVPWEYEPQCFASPAGQYLPDFRISASVVSMPCEQPIPIYVEVKPTWAAADASVMLAQQEIITATERTALFLAVAEDRGSPALWTPHSDADGDMFVAWLWVYDATSSAPPALAVPIDNGPWPAGYWQPKAKGS